MSLAVKMIATIKNYIEAGKPYSFAKIENGPKELVASVLEGLTDAEKRYIGVEVAEEAPEVPENVEAILRAGAVIRERARIEELAEEIAPKVTERTRKAACDFVEEENVTIQDPHTATVRSGNNDYTVEKGACNCQASTHERVCKHRIAVQIERRYLVEAARLPASPVMFTTGYLRVDRQGSTWHYHMHYGAKFTTFDGRKASNFWGAGLLVGAPYEEMNHVAVSMGYNNWYGHIIYEEQGVSKDV